MIELARILFHQDWDVHLFALEHRYYGESVPKANQQQEFKFLSSRQAVRDIVEFVKSPQALKHIMNSSNNTRWITFGGSYPGMLAGWSRLLNPDIVWGAVANSAPVEARVDFRRYNDHVRLDLKNDSLGGSKKCLDIVERGHAEVAAILEGGDSDSIRELAEYFNVCGGAELFFKDRKNIDFFVGYPLLPINVQSNDPREAT